MASVDFPGAVVPPTYVTPATQTVAAAGSTETLPAAETVPATESTPALEASVPVYEGRLHRAAEFEPVANVQLSEDPPLTAREPIGGVLRGDELTQRISTLRVAAARRLIDATYTRETLNQSLRHAGPGVSESMLQQVDAFNRASHTIQEMGDLLKVLKDDAGVEALQEHLKDSAISEATGSEIDTDGVYGPGTDESIRQRIQQPDLTYVPPAQLRQGAEDVFVYQKSEVGEDGGTKMEAQANCGPASMAMVIERQGGDAPTMKDLREEVNAPTGNSGGHYALDSDQITKGITETLAEQGIQVETDVDIFSKSESDEVIETMRAKLAAGEDVILLTSNMGSGSSTGHYVVVNEVRADGSFVVHDPQDPEGANVVQTADDLEAAMQRRESGKDTRVISIRQQA